ncbi:hypothetical protein [Victivallis lenta]|uniref:hypothetical protein n=1 Tax=Victivallis lenta TaxID=2606640 RepID=UPI0023555530|nr:hypothetical protein [Victivallis lenta]
MKKKKEYAVGEVFRHTDGKLYRCVESKICKGCAFKYLDMGCLYGLNCRSTDREDGRSVKFIAVTEPAEGMLYRAENGRMYRLTRGSHWGNQCACDTDLSLSCAVLGTAVFGGALLGWYWSPVEEDAPAPVEPPKPVESPKRHIELAVVKVEGDKVTFRIVEQTHRCDEFSRQANTDEFKAVNGIGLLSYSVPEWLPLDSALYCRGKGKAQDLREITCTAVEFAQICEAVAEYNATDGRGYEKPWPSMGDKYFYIAVEGEVGSSTFYDTHYEHKMRVFGNLFRTEAEAEAAIERVKQALKK